MYGYQEGSVENGAAILGAHCEGPFISLQRAGAHPHECIRSPTEGQKSVDDMYGDISNVRLVTMAPELDGAFEAYKYLVSRGITSVVRSRVWMLEQPSSPTCSTQ